MDVISGTPRELAVPTTKIKFGPKVLQGLVDFGCFSMVLIQVDFFELISKFKPFFMCHL